MTGVQTCALPIYRTQVARPVQQLTQPEGINKGAQPTAQPDLSPETVAKAMGGDGEAALRMFKNIKPSEIPNTLIEPLAKVH